MPPLPPVANCLKYTQQWVCGVNSKPESIFHFTYTGGTPTASNLAGLAADIQAAAVTEFKPWLHTSYKVGVGTALDIASNTGASGVGGSATAGTMTGQPLPCSNAVVINHAIARRYRGGKPRTYLPPPDNTEMQTVGQWTSAFQTSIGSAFASFITTALASTVGGISLTAYGAVSYYTGGALRTTPVFEAITASSARTAIGSQRRRLKGA